VIASARLAASITAKPASGKADDMKAEFSVRTPPAKVLRTCTGTPATPKGAALFQFRVVGVSCIADVFGCAFISRAVAISNRHEFRHLEFP
jgi:hypothetical protein